MGSSLFKGSSESAVFCASGLTGSAVKSSSSSSRTSSVTGKAGSGDATIGGSDGIDSEGGSGVCGVLPGFGAGETRCSASKLG